MNKSDLIGLVGIIVGVIGTIATTISIAIALLGSNQSSCNVAVGEVNITCIVAP